jgi:hypothetical protein
MRRRVVGGMGLGATLRRRRRNRRAVQGASRRYAKQRKTRPVRMRLRDHRSMGDAKITAEASAAPTSQCCRRRRDQIATHFSHGPFVGVAVGLRTFGSVDHPSLNSALCDSSRLAKSLPFGHTMVTAD